MKKEIYKNSKRIVTITKEFLDDQLGEKDWNNETIVKFDKDTFGIGDVIYRLRGRSSSEDNAWDYNVMVRENTL
jgi:hypothetical protein